MDQYWNNIDEDGESQSDCASSLGCRDDEAIVTQSNQRAGNMISNLQPTPEVEPVKKKRPPRKRKKKQQQQDQHHEQKEDQKSESTEIASKEKNGDKAPSTQQNTNQKVEPGTSIATQNKLGGNVSNQVTNSSKQKESSPKITETRQSEPMTKTASMKTSWSTVSTKKSPQHGETKASSLDPKTVIKAKEPKAVPWETAGKANKIVAPSWEPVKRKDNGKTAKGKTVNSTNNSTNNSTYNRTGGTPWETKGSSSLPHNHREIGTSGASDWRNHTLSRNVSSSNGTSRNHRIGGSAQFGNTDGWPSLSKASTKKDKSDMWPSLGTSLTKTSKSNAAPQSVKPKTTQGVWGSRGSTKNAWGKPPA